jgi:hypothetical protein
MGVESCRKSLDDAAGRQRVEAVLPPQPDDLQGPAFRSIRGSIRPTNRSPNWIGRT